MKEAADRDTQRSELEKKRMEQGATGRSDEQSLDMIRVTLEEKRFDSDGKRDAEQAEEICMKMDNQFRMLDFMLKLTNMYITIHLPRAPER